METDNFYIEKKCLFKKTVKNKCKLFFLFLILLLYIVTPGYLQAQTTPSQRQVARQFTFDFRTPPCYGYLEYLPENYNSQPNTQFPVVIFLHGVGECGNGTSQIWNVANSGPPMMVKNGRNFPFILISPQSPPNEWWQPSTINKLVDYVVKTYRIDQNRIYITGLSYGGYGTWGYAGAYPDKIAAAVPICGCGTTNKAPGMKNLSLWAFHNNEDNIVNSVCTTTMIDEIKKAGGSPLMTLYPKFGHDAWTATYNDQKMWDWLLKQSKYGEITNISPVANAGSNATITLPTTTLTLKGTGSDQDGSIVSYLWTKQSGPTLVLENAATANVTLKSLVAGTYVLRLTVTDNLNDKGYDEVTVIVKPEVVNQAPVANAGADQKITLPVNQTNLEGAAVDNDGTIASYLWTKKSGPEATLSSLTNPTLSLSNLLEGTYVFELQVTDDDGATDLDEVAIIVNPAIVNQAPEANAGTDKQINLPTNTINITGSGSDSDGEIVSYLWTKKSGPSATLGNTDNSTVSLSDLMAGTYVLQLTVSDNKGEIGQDEMSLTVLPEEINQAPLVYAGVDKNIYFPDNSLTIKGTASDPDGSVVDYLWTKQSGPSVTLSFTKTIDLQVTDLLEGYYVFRLTVTDDDGAIAYDEIRVHVIKINAKPVVNAGEDIILTLPENDTTLTGSASDSDGTIASYLWRKMSGPEVTLLDSLHSNLALADLEAGEYIFRLITEDNEGELAWDEVKITVNTVYQNRIPIVSAVADVYIHLPDNDTILTGSAYDPDGTITSYLWRKISGPAITLEDTIHATLNLTALTEGAYLFRLFATDNQTAVGWEDVEVVVSPENLEPTVSAGDNIELYLPISSTNLVGAANDPDGTITSYQWTQISGPKTSTITNAERSASTVSGLIEGTFVYRLTVNDNDNASKWDEVRVIVFPDSSNKVPVANAGLNKNIILPINSVNLVGSGSDSDGSIVSYTWSKISGPNVTIVNANKSTVSLSNLLEGSYVFRLEVKDNKNARDADDVSVVVSPSTSNQKPTASAGTNRIITLPTNTITLKGTGSDPEGGKLTYNWTQRSGAAASLINFNSPNVTIENLVAGTFVFRLTIADEGLASDWDEVTVTVHSEITNEAPTAIAGEDIIVTWPRRTSMLYGSGSDADGAINYYKWEKISGPEVTTEESNNNSTLELSQLNLGEYIFRLTVKDDKGASAYDDVKVIVNEENRAPVVNAGPDRSLTLPQNSLDIAAVASDDDGNVVSYHWSKRSGGNATLTNENSAIVTITNLAEGSYVFRILITDNEGATAFADVAVIVSPASVNQAPIANAGKDISLFLPQNSISIVGAGSDPEGTILSYHWEKKSGPSATLANVISSTLTASDLLEGVYIFKLTVIDDKEASGSDEVKVVVYPPKNELPVAHAGEDITITLPDNEVVLEGTGEDIDGTITSYVWRKIEGPSFSSPEMDKSVLHLSDLKEGTFIFRLTVTDNDQGSGYDDITVNVVVKAKNQIPVASAGEDLVLTLPENNVVIYGSADDPDGSISSYLWTKEDGPSATIINASSATVEFRDLIEGKYIFKLTVTDNELATASDLITINVNRVNKAPTANAGADFSQSMEETQISLIGDGVDVDGTIIQYLWEQLSGPPVIIENPSEANAYISEFAPGTYKFQLRVMDNDSALAYDELIVNVEEAVSKGITPPKIVTPNGDGKNDIWFIEGLGNLTYEVVIVNSRGMKVFEANPYQNNWDIVKDGGASNDGEYYYILKCNETKEIKRGAIRVIH
ncbi:MAG TPA: PKD domain-containing protein [Cytophagales bacterium]|nr:PKD domain-containing protein [Cytophagales bacterium]